MSATIGPGQAPGLLVAVAYHGTEEVDRETLTSAGVQAVAERQGDHAAVGRVDRVVIYDGDTGQAAFTIVVS